MGEEGRSGAPAHPAGIPSFLGEQAHLPGHLPAQAGKTNVKVTRLVCHMPAAGKRELEQDVFAHTLIEQFAFIKASFNVPPRWDRAF